MKLPAIACYSAFLFRQSYFQKHNLSYVHTLPRQDTRFEHKTHNTKNENITRGLAVNPVKRIHFICSVEMSSMTVPNHLFVDTCQQAQILPSDDIFVQIKTEI